MNKDSDRLGIMISEKRVKLHVFEPTGRRIWTVVGKGGEHWVDPEADFCSCHAFYFGQSNGKASCYHSDLVSLAIREDRFETIVFSDEEFSDFLSGLISDL